MTWKTAILAGSFAMMHGPITLTQETPQIEEPLQSGTLPQELSR